MEGMRTSHSERFTPHSIEDILKDRTNKKESDEEYDYRGGGDERLGETRRESDKNYERYTDRNREEDGIPRRKKMRTTFTGRQIFELEKMFETKKYLNASERSQISR